MAKMKKKAPVGKKAPAKMAAKAETPIVKSRRATSPKNGQTQSYTQSEFIENVMGFCGLRKRSEAKMIWGDISLFIVDSLKRGYKIPLVGLGKLYVRRTKPRVGRNPATGEPINIPAKKRIRFAPAKALKMAVLQ